MREVLADTVLMIRPAAFGYNPETRVSNAFQRRAENLSPGEIQDQALFEFDRFVMVLRKAGVRVLVFEDQKHPETPDAVFPNNWFCTLPGGDLLTFPMQSKTRRKEIREDILAYLTETYGFSIKRELERFAEQDKALEGTGSLVLDHQNRAAYAAVSPRTDREALSAFEALSGYKVVSFRALGPDRKPIYHTNVMMCLGPDFAILAPDTIVDKDRARVLEALEDAGKRLLALPKPKVYRNFAGNMLCLKGQGDKRLLVMSKAAEDSLSRAERGRITGDFNCRIVSSPLALIERLGGGSARCMLAEVFV